MLMTVASLIIVTVLRRLCRNPDGLFWAGDTAQTISAGSSFTFNELKSFLFRFEVCISILATLKLTSLWQKRLEARSSIEPKSRKEPRMFQLPVNYRSHAGIVNCAQSVVEIITNLWPNSIDILAPEKGMVDGVKPLFFGGLDEDQAAFERFIFGAS
jgi:hypothetical protein